MQSLLPPFSLIKAPSPPPSCCSLPPPLIYPIILYHRLCKRHESARCLQLLTACGSGKDTHKVRKAAACTHPLGVPPLPLTPLACPSPPPRPWLPPPPPTPHPFGFAPTPLAWLGPPHRPPCPPHPFTQHFQGTSTARVLCMQVMSMWLEGDAYEFRKAVPRQWLRLGGAAKVLGSIKSPMPGKIIQVKP